MKLPIKIDTVLEIIELLSKFEYNDEQPPSSIPNRAYNLKNKITEEIKSTNLGDLK